MNKTRDLQRVANLLGINLEHFQRRLLQDAINEATAAYWTRRAAVFANVGTPACDQTAQACRNAAAFHRWLRDPDNVTLAAAS